MCSLTALTSGITAREADFTKSVGQEVTSPWVAMETPNDGASQQAQQRVCETAVPPT